MSGASCGGAGAAMRRCGRRNQSSTMHISATGRASQESRTMTDIRDCGIGRTLVFAADLQHCEEGFLWNLDVAELFHALLTLLLLLEELALAGDVAAVAFCQHVLAQRLDCRACDDRTADCRLHRHLEHLPGNELLHLVHELAAAVVGTLAVHDDRKRIDLV